MEIALVLLPLLARRRGGARPVADGARPLVLPVAAFLHLALLAAHRRSANVSSGRGVWLRLDPLGTVILGTVSVLFLALRVLRARLPRAPPRPRQPGLLRRPPRLPRR